jgi:hypothetical protein
MVDSKRSANSGSRIVTASKDISSSSSEERSKVELEEIAVVEIFIV